jgi:ribonuclease H / adenosylcobalamin/alpha-ribazole phosphatase
MALMEGAGPMAVETTLVLVRHGATGHTAQGRFSGSTGAEPALSGLGEWQAARAAARLAARPGIAAVVTSPAARARRTAELIATACAVPLDVDADLREVNFGAWEGRTGAEVQRDWPAELAAWRSGAPVSPPGGEPVEDVGARAARARAAAVGRHAGGTVILVSHLYPVRTSVTDALGVPRATIHRMLLGPASLSEIRATVHGATTLVTSNDVAHLADEPAR